MQTTDIRLRPAQEAILTYDGGRLAVSAVPGSGKTFTLSLLAAQLLQDGLLNAEAGQEVLIVTYLNSSVDNFKSAIRKRLEALDRPPVGFDVRTMHSLSWEIIKLVWSGDTASQPTVLDDAQSTHYLTQAVAGWRDAHPDVWAEMVPTDTPNARIHWRELVERTAKVFVRTAKNERFRPNDILQRFDQQPAEERTLFIQMLAEIYERYQAVLSYQGALDYDDQVWLAADYLEQTPRLAERLRYRWPYVLEDEAQDSVPLQEVMLGALTGGAGNWVRVGDPNQAITSTFTAAHPRHFNAFGASPDVVSRPLPNSGRCAPMVFETANALIDWVQTAHPVPEVARHTFRAQRIEATPPNDAQPNPPDADANVVFRTYDNQVAHEIPTVCDYAQRYMEKFPTRTVAILVPTHNFGMAVSSHLDTIHASYDSLIRGGTREKMVAQALYGLLSVLANPLARKPLASAYEALLALNHPVISAEADVDDERVVTMLKSVRDTTTFLFPADDPAFLSTLPAGIGSAADIDAIVQFSRFLQQLFDLRSLPIGDLALALGDLLFANPAQKSEIDLAIAYQIAFILTDWQDREPTWRLPDLVAQLADVASGRRRLNVTVGDSSFEPRPQYITLATQHSAKGLEWDAVFLVGMDRYWIPETLDDYFLGVEELIGGDPSAEAQAQLRKLMLDDDALYANRTATEAAHIDVISERLRLLYVGITRARRFLQVSRSRVALSRGKERPREPSAAIAALDTFVTNYKR